MDQFTADFQAQNLAHCIPPEEHFYYTYQRNEYHYTLYYYDQAGNLVQTVPPAGFKGVSDAGFTNQGEYIISPTPEEPDHRFLTRYVYNSLNQPIKQLTPDGGLTNFYYDLKGRLIASRNAKQQKEWEDNDESVYSYTLYDEQGRITEVGEGNDDGTTPHELDNIDVDDPQGDFDDWLAAADKSQVTQTYYDNTDGYSAGMDGEGEFPGGEQQHLRARVTAVTISNGDPATQTTPDAATYYSYDEHGNVNYLVNDNPTLTLLGPGNQYKHTSYTYDLISGKVNTVDYQKNFSDEFHHKYYYDADNRLTIAMTSNDGQIWEKDAKCFYYKHGPLARTEIGEDKVQGNDYAYTLQGWLKGMNSNTLDPNRDIGHDGYGGSTNTWIHNTSNQYISTDAFGFTLGYYDNDAGGDYSPVSGLKTSTTNNTNYYFEAITHNMPLTDPQDFTGGSIAITPLTADHNYLYNGNISHMVTAMMNEENGVLPTQGNAYEYDQLNRIIATQRYDNYTSTGPHDYIREDNTWASAVAIDAYQERYSYSDPTSATEKFGPNGNLMQLSRNNGTGTPMDDLTYHYNTAYTNKLSDVADAIGSGVSTVDIDNQSADNYTYDEIGNLTHDDQEEIDKIEWTVYGKIKSITRTTGSTKPDLEFAYDAMGNRITKTVKPRNSNGILPIAQWGFTYYSRDAQGNIMAVYDRSLGVETIDNEQTVVDEVRVAEWDLYGSSRTGIKDGNGRSMGGVNFEMPNGFNTWTSMYTGSQIALYNPQNMTGTHNTGLFERIMGLKRYELSNHLGNVMEVIDDLPVGQIAGSPTSNQLTIAEFYYPHILSYQDYFSFGMITPDRSHSSNSYRFGFNGKENDNEVKGTGGQQDYGMRIYDPRLGKFLSVDPLTKDYAYYTPYQFSGNMPIWAIDLDGLEQFKTTKGVLIYSQSDNGVVYIVDDNYLKYQVLKEVLVQITNVETGEVSYEKQFNLEPVNYADFMPSSLQKNSGLYQNLMNNAQANPLGNELMEMYNDDPTCEFNGKDMECSPTSFKRYKKAYEKLNGIGSFEKGARGSLYAIWNFYRRSENVNLMKDIPREFDFTASPGALVYLGLTDKILSPQEVWSGQMEPGGVLRLQDNGGGGHSVIFLGYLFNKNGEITGLNYWDQHTEKNGYGEFKFDTINKADSEPGKWQIYTGANPE